MPTQDDVRRIALALPHTSEDEGYFRFVVGGKAIAWVWLERLEPKKARVPNDEVVAIRVAHDSDKEPLIEMAPDALFTEPHYNGFPAILVRLAAVDPALLEKLLTDAWRIQAPKRLVREYDEAAAAG
ncbi:MAG TPA: MmcQ/YjbR family DNA-binding protein [Candidatus Limnocylindrales bacterium]|nr:MmcQ/YjbR family DNA-binding protein [Candidatus Limnocylindrales bacterium]